MSYYIYFFDDGELQSVTNEREVSSKFNEMETTREIFLQFSDQILRFEDYKVVQDPLEKGTYHLIEKIEELDPETKNNTIPLQERNDFDVGDIGIHCDLDSRIYKITHKFKDTELMRLKTSDITVTVYVTKKYYKHILLDKVIFDLSELALKAKLDIPMKDFKADDISLFSFFSNYDMVRVNENN